MSNVTFSNGKVSILFWYIYHDFVLGAWGLTFNNAPMIWANYLSISIFPINLVTLKSVKTQQSLEHRGILNSDSIDLRRSPQ